MRVTAVDPRLATPSTRPTGPLVTVKHFVALTKPRIIELLLVTTIPTMILAAGGLPSAWLVLATLVGGSLAAASANTLNCVYDRDIDRLMHRTRSRPLATGAVSVRCGAGVRTRPWCAVGRLARRHRQRPVGAPGTGRHRLLRPRLHDAAEAAHPAEHRVGRSRRLHARPDRLGRRHRLAVMDPLGPVRRDLLLDPTALLAAVAALPRRLRVRGRADAPGGGRAASRGPPDRRLLVADGRGDAGPVADRPDDVVLRRRGRRGRAGPSSWRPTPCSSGCAQAPPT